MKSYKLFCSENQARKHQKANSVSCLVVPSVHDCSQWIARNPKRCEHSLWSYAVSNWWSMSVSAEQRRRQVTENNRGYKHLLSSPSTSFPPSLNLVQFPTPNPNPKPSPPPPNDTISDLHESRDPSGWGLMRHPVTTPLVLRWVSIGKTRELQTSDAYHPSYKLRR